MTRRKITKESIEADALAVAEWIRATNGCRSFDVAARFGFGRDYGLQVLKAAAKHGICKVRIVSSLTLWMTEEEKIARLAEAKKQRRKADNLRRKAARQRAADEAQAADADAAVDIPVRQYWVAANNAPPIRVSRPMSIFEVAA